MSSASWFLEGAAAGGNILVIGIERLPFRVGRDPQSDLTMAATDVSRNHARIEADGVGGLVVVDLGSTNGTFLNRERFQGTKPLKEGDILHFGTTEFRLRCKAVKKASEGDAGFAPDATVMIGGSTPLPENFLLQEKEFLEMLDKNLCRVAWQPIVHFQDLAPYAYEVLGRGGHPALPPSPIRLFALAAALKKEVELSRAFRAAAAEVARTRAANVRLFMNTHPLEMFTDAFYQSLDDIRAVAPAMELVVEVHETAVAEVDRMKVMAKRLRDMGISIAYDDFGAGQSRLNELAEVPPEVVKFDMGLIRDIHRASEKKQQMVARLVGIVLDIGSQALAEGVETEDEATICKQMGFQLCQGYLTGKPELV